MLVIRSTLLCSCFLLIYLATSIIGTPVGANSHPLRILPFIVRRSDGSSECSDVEVITWTNDFHECFIDRKYKDGGRNLNYIVDRILEHSEACMELSSKECRPDFRGFTALMNKTIAQIKDYAEMYLENIYKGREMINDLDCVETNLNLKTYEDCFRRQARQDNNASEEMFQKMVNEGLFCTNRAHLGCSREAKTTLNGIVRIIFGVERPTGEEFEEVTTTTEAPETTTPRTYPEYEESEEVEEEAKPTEAPAWMWYDYLAYPFVAAWNWISSLFG